jgi:acyl-CoA dehydrogenase
MVAHGHDPGFTVGRLLEKMGWPSSDTRELIFADCFVPQERVLGEVGRGFYQIADSFQTGRITLSGMGVGLAQAAFDDALDLVAMTKLYTAKMANRVADSAVQIFGGYGYIEETRVAMHYRDARILRIGGGTDEIQMEILAKRAGL